MLCIPEISPFYIAYSPINASVCSGETAQFSGYHESSRFIGDQDNATVKYLTNPECIHSGDWPLVLFGISGTGKTALATSLIGRFAEIRNKKSLVFTADGFRRKLSNSIETNSLTEFRDQLKKSAAILIDDIQKLRDYPTAQAELANLLDLLDSTKTPIIFTLKSSEIADSGILPRLFSRLTSGLCIRVNRPGQDARRILLLESAELAGFKLDDESLEYLSSVLVVTYPKIRSFFHLFTHWLQTQQISKPELIHLPLVLQFLTSLIGSDMAQSDLVIKLVAKSFNLKPRDIKSSSRKQTVVAARGVCMYLLRSLSKMSFSRIGSIMGGRDHSTVMHGIERIHENLVTNKKMAEKISIIKISILENSFLNLDDRCVQPVD